MTEAETKKLLAKLGSGKRSVYLSEKEKKALSAALGDTSRQDEDDRLASLEHALKLKDSQLDNAKNDIRQLRESLDALYDSKSWKLAAPLRIVKDSLRTKKLRKRGRKNKKGKVQQLATDQVSPEPMKALTQTAPSVQLGSKASAPVKYVPRDNEAAPQNLPAALYAFYLPQFHPIAQNDEWWGEGFTEWTNVRPTKPLYEGHYQPHEPDPKGKLGYYDLRDTSEVMSKQIELARKYGVEGFCFYFYWFAGERLLETPLLNLLEDKELDVPFCLCWANENWSRRWDGRESDILMAQNHSTKDDLAFISYISKYLKDPRYRRIDGKPLLIVYRPIELPNAKATAKRWRDWCRKNGVGEIYLAYTQSFENNDPRDYGFDGAIEFPPNNSAPPDITDQVIPLSDDFDGTVFDWDIFPTRSDNYNTPEYPLFRTVCPAWDNTPRRKQAGTVFAGSTPARYQHWLANALADSEARIEDTENRLIFINAWNEWAEGAHLEPDARYGHAYLAATRDALIAHNFRSKKHVVLVSHDALHHGAQILTLNMARMLKQEFGYRVDIIVLGDGPLIEAFSEFARVHNISGLPPNSDEVITLITEIKSRGADLAICNTTVSSPLTQTFKEAGYTVISLIHELGSVIAQYNLETAAKHIAAHADKIVFPAPLVRDNFESVTGTLGDKAVICPQGAYKINRFRDARAMAKARKKLRSKLDLSPTIQIILGVGYADNRKGFDLFLDLADSLPEQNSNRICVWIGHQEPWVEPTLQARMDALCEAGKLILPGRVSDTDLFYAGADIYVLTSREDPYPSTVLEALDVGLPVIGFEGVTGSTDLITAHGGELVPAFDIEALKSVTFKALLTTGDKARENIWTAFRARSDISFRGYVHDLLALGGHGLERNVAQVSAVVPNYNYARYLKDRVGSIEQQSYPLREIIILDDSSTDNSLEVISEICERAQTPMRFIPNETNSGSVFAQWLKGVEAARGDYVWIAEADDLAYPNFLQSAMAGFEKDPDLIMSYTQSSQMGENGDILDPTYLQYVSDIDNQMWRENYMRTGADELRYGLSVKNSIPNVSAVVFHRESLLKVLRAHIDEIKSYRVAGDWATYMHILAGNSAGKIAYHATPLNLHRRHADSVTIARFGEAEFEEIKRLQVLMQSRVDVPQAYKQKAAHYLATLRAQFDLDIADAAQ